MRWISCGMVSQNNPILLHETRPMLGVFFLVNNPLAVQSCAPVLQANPSADEGKL